MPVAEDDILVINSSEVYRIARSEFNQTYNQPTIRIQIIKASDDVWYSKMIGLNLDVCISANNADEYLVNSQSINYPQKLSGTLYIKKPDTKII